MSKLEVCALASGSNGNCYYIGNDQEAILVDVGLSARQLQLRLQEKGIAEHKIKALLITHEHCDHARGARVLSKRLHIPVYITKKTFLALSKANRPEHVVWFDPDQSFSVGEFEVHAFSKSHDAADACSFRVSYAGKHVGVMTDIGEACDQVKSHFSACHAVFLESNYDEDMLMSGPYPYYLKQRVSSAVGHLSNLQAYELANEFAGENLRTIFLSHLSGENNTPEIADAVFDPLRSRFQVELTSRHQSTAIFEL
ncbi:MBL fold metallo-hydrolase [Mangrovibacterium diazotrophicum]|uniref:Phosphoribosyl 1,2-cyclic phosphodiesterase n=1 Tax=Mangrovibacterium diazotrophicum TaxID=1261403 RepID=A0A419VVZ4_9BACT|nr:MBL fold metallo-hydrolase [Mangrovibacterium diazotrophicum]RKD86152.1 phosphoribosyl 1,2-cyclic phosphodiesterase [Mangrovibacterium diazotrophicum]